MSTMEFLDSVEYDLSQGAIPQNVIEQYEVGQLLFSSHHSQIFSLIRKSDRHVCTLKAISKNSSLTFDFESILNLKHSRLPNVYYIGQSTKYVYVIKDYIPGMTLRKFLESRGNLTDAEIFKLCMQLLDIIEYFHHPDRSIVYRDIKPDNIIIDKDGELFLIDLETIRIVKKDSDSDTVSIVTRGFASPEQYGYSQTDQRSDIYSFGATLYFIFKKVPPSPFHPNFDGIPTKWQAVISKCLKFNPQHRYKDIATLRRHLRLSNNAFARVAKRVSILLAGSLCLFIAVIIANTYLHNNEVLGIASSTELTDEVDTDETINISVVNLTESIETTEGTKTTSTIEETDAPTLQWSRSPDSEDERIGYMALYEDIPDAFVGKHFEFVITIINTEIEGTHAVYMYQMDHFGHANQTGSDGMLFIEGEAFSSFSSPTNALHYIEGYSYDFIIYVDDNRNKMYDKGEYYAVIKDRMHDGKLLQYLEFDEWYR